MLESGKGGTYTYGSGLPGEPGPHAVVATTNYGSGWTYDANGNMTTGPGGKTLDYYSFNRTRSIQKPGVMETFEYGPDRERVLRLENSTQTFYIGTLFERVTDGSTTVDKSYIYAAGRMVAVHQPGASSLEAVQADLQYFHQDYRRSVESVTDQNGIVLRKGLSYDPWGRRRNSDGTDPNINAPPLYSDTTTKGFTGQEQLDLLGLVFLNARIYDPILGRFLSPDPVVQAPLNPQNLNRYSYAINNPMIFDDPSGESFLSVLRTIGAVVAAVVVAVVATKLLPVVAPALFSTGGVATGIVAGAAGGATFGAISTGTAQGTLWGAVTGAVFGGIGGYLGGDTLSWGQVLADGAAGGTLAELRGGSFVQGFLSAGFASVRRATWWPEELG